MSDVRWANTGDGDDVESAHWNRSGIQMQMNKVAKNKVQKLTPIMDKQVTQISMHRTKNSLSVAQDPVLIGAGHFTIQYSSQQVATARFL